MLEAEAVAAERERDRVRALVDAVAALRRGRQEEAAGELAGLAEDWRRGVGGLVGALIAVEGARAEVREALRQGV